jgi:hypothetical protein
VKFDPGMGYTYVCLLCIQYFGKLNCKRDNNAEFIAKRYYVQRICK